MASALGGSRRSLGLDVLRALAALMVVGFHSYGASYGYGLYTLKGAPFDLVFHLAGGVYLFFALSGYLISRPFIRALVGGDDLPAMRSYARRRILRIFPLYLVAFAAQLTLTDQWKTPPALLVVHGLLLHNLVRGQSSAIFTVSWTLSLEFLFYVFLPLAALLVRRLHGGAITPRQLAWGVAGLWAASFVWALVVGSLPTTTTTTWLAYSFPGMVGMFCPGMLLAVIEQRTTEPRGVVARFEGLARDPALMVALVVTLYLVATACASTGGRQLGVLVSHHVDAVAYGLAVALVLRVELSARWWTRLLAWLGTISYGIYLWQGVLGDYWASHPWNFPLHRSLGVATIPTIVVIVLIPTIAVSWLSWNGLESPLIRFSHRKRRPAVVPAGAAT